MAQEFPQILKSLKDMESEEGSKAVFEVEVSGKPKSIKWYKNGEELEASQKIHIDTMDDSHFRLTIDDVDADDVANIRVEASNDVGAVSSEAALTIRKTSSDRALTLTVVKGLRDQTIRENDDFELAVEFSTAPTLIIWYKNKKRLMDTGRFFMEQADMNVYRCVVKRSDADDTGTYRVVASNDAGTVTVESKAQVIVKPDVLDVEPANDDETEAQPTVELVLTVLRGLDDQKATENDQIVLEAEFSYKPDIIKWYKKDTLLKTTKHIRIDKISETVHRLTIPKCQLDDSGNYRVEASLKDATVSSSAKLSVEVPSEEPPTPEPVDDKAALTIVQYLQDQSARDGDNVGFDVEFSSRPKSVKWYKNGKELTASKKIRFVEIDENTYRLLLTDVNKEENEAVYKVEAEKDGSIAQSEAKLTVQGQAPRFVKGLKNVKTPPGVKIIFEIEVEGRPKTVKWYRNGKEVKSSKRIVIEKIDDSVYRLIFVDVQKDDGATYKVSIANDYGSADSEGQLTIEDRSLADCSLQDIRKVVREEVTKALQSMSVNLSFSPEL